MTATLVPPVALHRRAPEPQVVRLAGAREAARHTGLLLRLRWRTIRNPVARVLLVAAAVGAPLLVAATLGTGAELDVLLRQPRSGNLAGFGLDSRGGAQRLAAALVLAVPLGLLSPLTGVSTPPLAEPEDLGVLRPSRLSPATDGLVTVLLTPLSVVQLLTLSLAAGLFAAPRYPGPLLVLLVVLAWLSMGATTSLLGWVREDIRRRWALRRASQGKELSRTPLLTFAVALVGVVVGYLLKTSGSFTRLVDATVVGLRPVGHGELLVLLPALAVVAGLGIAAVAGTLRWADAALLLPPTPTAVPKAGRSGPAVAGRAGRTDARAARAQRFLHRDVRAARLDGGSDGPWLGLARLFLRAATRVPECRNPLTTVTGLTMGGVLIAVVRGSSGAGGAGQVSGTLVPIGVALAAGVNALALLGPGCVWLLSEPRTRRLLPRVLFVTQLLGSLGLAVLAYLPAAIATGFDLTGLTGFFYGILASAPLAAAGSLKRAVRRPYAVRLGTGRGALVPPLAALRDTYTLAILCGVSATLARDGGEHLLWALTFTVVWSGQQVWRTLRRWDRRGDDVVRLVNVTTV